MTMKLLIALIFVACFILIVQVTSRVYALIEKRKPKPARVLGIALFVSTLALLAMQILLEDFVILYAVVAVLLYLNTVYSVFALSKAQTWYGKVGWIFGFVCLCFGCMLESACLLMWDFRVPL